MATPVEVCAAAAPTSDDQALPPFELAYDSSSAVHCDGRVEMALEDLEAAEVRFERDGDADVSDVCAELRRMRDAADEEHSDDVPTDVQRLSDGQLNAVEQALDDLEACDEYRCDCPSWAWESDKDFFDSELQQLGDRVWALVGYDDRGLTVLNEHLSIDNLFAALPISMSYGFDSVSLKWDGRRLAASFSGYPWGSDELTAVPLEGIRLDAYETWTSCDNDDPDVMAKPLVTLPETVLAAVVEVVENDEWDFSEFWFTQLLDLLAPLGSNAAAREMAVAMFPEWEKTPAELAEACLAIAGDSLADAA